MDSTLLFSPAVRLDTGMGLSRLHFYVTAAPNMSTSPDGGFELSKPAPPEECLRSTVLYRMKLRL